MNIASYAVYSRTVFCQQNNYARTPCSAELSSFLDLKDRSAAVLGVGSNTVIQGNRECYCTL